MKKVLVVDDDLVVLATLSMGLQRAGYQILQADNGAAALEIEARESPDMVILDMRMPGMDGLAVAKALRQRRSVPFIFLSAFNDDSIVKAAAEAGALGYLVKPIEIARIVPAIEIAMVRHDELSKLEKGSTNLADALGANREIDVAVGLLMERYGVDRARAFNAMRDHARAERCKITAVAQQLIEGKKLELIVK